MTDAENNGEDQGNVQDRVRRERAPRDNREERYEGKAREEWHPQDRKSGTGRGRRDAKGGAGKAGWGEEKKADGAEVAEGTKPAEGEEATPDAEATFAAAKGNAFEGKNEEAKVEESEEEEDNSVSYADYMAARNAKATGVLKTKEVREHTKITDKKLIEDKTEKQRTEGEFNNNYMGA